MRGAGSVAGERRAKRFLSRQTTLAATGLGYAAVFIEDFPQDTSHLIVEIISALGLASMICLVAFVGLRLVYRVKLDQRREECHLLVTKLLESRLGKPVTTTRRESRPGGGNRETVQASAGGNGSPLNNELTARG